MTSSKSTIASDVDAIQRIEVIPTLLEVICNTTGMGFAAVARVTTDQWVACSVRDEILFGLKPGGELPLKTTICHEIQESRRLVVIDHVDEDALFNSHPTPKIYGFQSYISVPILRKDGSFFGTLCAIDPRPNKLNNARVIGMFNLFADLISFHLDVIEKLVASESSLLEERKTAELREQFIAVLGHDLRNPVSAISSSAQLLLRMPLDNTGTKLASVIRNSAIRINRLIESVLDFARGRMGDGISVNIKKESLLENHLDQAITELRSSHPGRQIESHILLNEPVFCDPDRMAQLLSNLLSNAITHGDAHAPIKVAAVQSPESFRLSVSNAGRKIPEDVLGKLFEPFARGNSSSGQQGLGLGLYIAAEIARAHGGLMEVHSTETETRFSFVMPSK